MKNQIITALSVIAVLGAAGGAFAANSSVLTSASSEPSTIGAATPVLVPVAPKGDDVPAEYRQRLADAVTRTLPGTGGVGAATVPAQVAPAQPAAPADGTSGGSGGYSDDDDDHDEDDHDEDESHDEDDHVEDESDDDD